MIAERLEEAWSEHRKSTLIDPVMRFSSEGLVLGAGTVLLPIEPPREGRNGRLEEGRLSALLAAAHLAAPTAVVIGHLRKAVERSIDGDEALAAMHIALSRAGRLTRPEADARRLFLADGLLKSGVCAEAIIKAIATEQVAAERFAKAFNPEEPREPAGSGVISGRWTSGGANSIVSVQPDGRAQDATSGERSPATLSPPGGASDTSLAAPYVGDDAPYRARRDCILYYYEMDQIVLGANDNFDPKHLTHMMACTEAEAVAIYLTFIVERSPKLILGAVRYPDGGLVISQKGMEDMYIPRGHRIPPLRKAVSTQRASRLPLLCGFGAKKEMR